MEYEDVLTIDTPEGVGLEIPLAGLGSRFVASLADLMIKGALLTLVALVVVPLLKITGVAVLIAASFLIYVGYDILFELLNSGQTPGKRSAHIRVVRAPNRPIDAAASAIRNVLRVIDGLPFSYIPGTISILVTKRNQRLGDLAAGTLVVRERVAAKKTPWIQQPAAASASAEGWDVSTVTAAELGAVRQFLERRDQLTADARRRLALSLAQALLPKVGGVQPGQDPEEFLVQVVLLKSSRSF
ncbi:MAG: RDD family protein [Thermoleophilaceae bacterium]